jgi:LysM repeat protein
LTQQGGEPIIVTDFQKEPDNKEIAMVINRRASVMVFLFAAAVLALSVPAPAAAESRTHVVEKGDTLWDISSSYLYDPFLWPKVWNANREIENPHLIYPGQNIIVPMDLADKSRKIKTVKPVLPPPDEVAKAPEPEPEPAPPEPMPEEVKQELIKAMSTYGFIIDQEEIGIGTITSMEEERMLIRGGDKVYVTTASDASLEVGRKYSIVRVFNKVKHPVTGKEVGYLARILGDLNVVAANEGLSTAVVGEVYRDVMMEDHIIEHMEYLQWLPKEDSGSAGVAGYILINPEGKRILGEADVAFVDAGSAQGLGTGDKLDLIFEKGAVEAGKAPPHEVIGQVEVVVPRENTSVVRVLETKREITLGTKVISP